MSTMPVTAPAHHPSTGGRLVAPDGEALPLRSASLEVDAAAGLARVVLRQVFANPHDDPLAVTYQLPLPADAAVGGYSFTLGDRTVVGEIDRRAAARERFEEALVEGRTAALLEQDRSSLFTQEIGNVPPGEEITCEIVLDQPLAWADGAWEWRFPTVVAPRYMGAEGRVPDRERVSVEVSETPRSPRVALDLAVRDVLTGEPTSPSHPVAAHDHEGTTRVTLVAERGARLDRDVVVRWPVATPVPHLHLDLARHGDDAFGLLALVPPAAEAPAVPRDLILLLDVSGSMQGEPLRQAKAVGKQLIASLGDDDRLEMIAFSRRAVRWRGGPARATEEIRAEATAWLEGLQAGGGTEMRTGIEAALASLRADAQRQVVLVTDGLIGFEPEIVRAVRSKPAGCRVHALGIGSSVNRTLTGGVARAGAGVEVIAGPGEDPGPAAERLLARTGAPLVVDLEVSGSAVRDTASRALPDLFAAAPARLPVALDPAGGAVVVHGRTPDGPWEQRLTLPPVDEGSEAVPRLYARERVEDLEAAAAAGDDVDAAIERLGLRFGIATRRTSWVAVSSEPTVDPSKPVKRERIPQEIPHATSVEGLGLRAPALAPPAAAPRQMAAREMRARKRSRPSMPSKAFHAMGGAFGGGSDDDVVSEPSRFAEPPGHAPEPTRPDLVSTPHPDAPVELQGTVRLFADGRLVIEIAIPGPLHWEPDQLARVSLSDGRAVTARVDELHTTNPTDVVAGQTVRLVLILDDPGAQPTAVDLPSGLQQWRITL